MRKMSEKLSKKDYALWILSIIVMYFVFEALGDFGNLGTLSSASPISLAEKSLFRLTYLAAGGVFAIFMGSLIYLPLRFREKRAEVATRPTVDYTSIGLGVVIVSAIALVWFSLPSLSPNIPLVLQFNGGIILAMVMLLLFALTFVLYKEYYND